MGHNGVKTVLKSPLSFLTFRDRTAGATGETAVQVGLNRCISSSLDLTISFPHDKFQFVCLLSFSPIITLVWLGFKNF